ncbi:MAG TPA: nucleotide exchange factor GrpE [Vicinamibacterales bacterium]|jgi:molecular chaperone GrpE|nr:nucleotide exchange factor GrpE [Vicinamibacterales bacterium]
MNNEPFEESQDEDPNVPDTAQDEAAETVDVEALKAERDALQDRLLRTAAEFDNYRKRIDRERREQSESAAASLLVEILPVVDNLERALRSPSGPEATGYRAGVELILRQLLDTLRKRGVTPIEALGTDFDPRFHQAVSQEASETHRDGEVMEEMQRGYMLGERLLRPAMVKVATS